MNTESSPGFSLRGRQLGLKLALSLVAGVIAVWLLSAGKLPIWPPEGALEQLSMASVAGYFLCFSLVHLLRAARWHWLLAPLGHVSMRRLINVSLIGFAAIVVLPLRSGEVVRPLMIRKNSGISGWAAGGTIGAERVIDGLMVSILLLFGLIFSAPLDPIPDRIGDLQISARIIPAATYSALGVFSLAFAMMALFYLQRERAQRLVSWLLGPISPRLASWFCARVNLLTDGLSFLPNFRKAWPFWALSLVYWLGNAAGTWLLAQGVGLSSMSYPIACVSMGVLALGILMPNAPGYFGAFQVSVYASLAMYYPAEQLLNQGAVFVFVLYAIQKIVTLGSALIAWLIEALIPAPP